MYNRATNVSATTTKATTHIIELSAFLDEHVSPQDEVVVTLNGRVIKGMNSYQAEHAGVIAKVDNDL